MMTAADIAHALTGHRVKRLAGGGFLVPCPVSGHGKGRRDRNASLLIEDGDKALLVKCFAGCAVDNVLNALRHRGLLEDYRQKPIRRKFESAIDHDEPRQHRNAAYLWQHRKPISGTLAERYLREARGITGPLPPTLGYLPPMKPEYEPAMIAVFGTPEEVEPGELFAGKLADPADAAIHLTKLKQDGSGKAEVPKAKISIGAKLGRPIVLAPVNDLLGLAITEGIEDALSAHAATGLGAWAASSAGDLPKLADKVPEYIEAVTIFQDDDEPGRAGAAALAERLRERGIEIHIVSL
jgi:hypothetical protein